MNNDKNEKRSHYMGYKISWLREQVADLLVHFEHVKSKNNIADIFTKIIPEEQFKGLRTALLGLLADLD